jgi:hypothetical protein
MIARRGHRASRPAAWLAAFAILLQALLLPVAQQPAGIALAGLSDDAIAGLAVAQHLCQAPGDTTPDDPGKAPLDHLQCCALCLSAHVIGGFVPPSAPAVVVNRDYGIVVPTEASLVLPQQRAILRQQPRAPPVLI